MSKKPRKILKTSLITIASLLGLCILAVLVLSWTILSPARLTATARKAMDRYVPCPTSLDGACLTLVKTYPFAGVRIDGLTLFDTMEQSPSDTLAHIGTLDVTANLGTFLKTGQIEISGLLLEDAAANIFTGPDGNSNLDIFSNGNVKADDNADNASGPNISLCLENLDIRNLSASYIDRKGGICATVAGFNLSADGCMVREDIDVNMDVFTNAGIQASANGDSINLDAVCKSMALSGDFAMHNGSIAASPRLSIGGIDLKMNGISAVSEALGIDISQLEADILDGRAGDIGAQSACIASKGTRANISMAADSCMDLTFDMFEALVPEFSFRSGDSTVSIGNSATSLDNIAFRMLAGTSPLACFNARDIDMNVEGNASTDMSHLVENMLIVMRSPHFAMSGSSKIEVAMDSLRLGLDSSVDSNMVKSSPSIQAGNLMFCMSDQVLVPGWPVSVKSRIEARRDMGYADIPLGLEIDGQKLDLHVSAFMNNGFDNISGTASVNAQTIDLKHITAMVPDSFKHLLEGISVSGTAGLAAKVKGNVNCGKAALENAFASVSLDRTDALLFDTVGIHTDGTVLTVSYPSAQFAEQSQPGADLVMSAGTLEAGIGGRTPIRASLGGVTASASALSLKDSLSLSKAVANISIGSLTAVYDTVSASLAGLSANAGMERTQGPVKLDFAVGMNSLAAFAGSKASLHTNRTNLTATASYDDTKEDLLLKWSPKFNVLLNDGDLQLNGIGQEVTLPKLDMDFSLGHFVIYDSRVQVGNSDIALTGEVYNIGAFLENTGLLTGKLYLESDNVDVNQIMAMTSGIGSAKASDSKTGRIVESDTTTAGPFIVPRGIDLAMHTNFDKIRFGDNIFNNVGGDVTVKDGKLVLQELGFSSNAAEMQLTAVYRSPTADSLFTELDFHLLDIEIDELISLIPSVDSVVPMLKSFDGQAQFHFAAETYLNRDYTPILSTLMGAAAIEGRDLVVMDNDVFKGVRRKLLMSRKAQNRIDSLDVELSVLSNKVTLYPFRISMDRYSAVIGGRHNINADMDCRYHISLVETPLPVRLGVTISGPVQEIAASPLKHISLQRPEYDTMYRPEKRSDVDDKVLWLKNDILEMLRTNVR